MGRRPAGEAVRSSASLRVKLRLCPGLLTHLLAEDCMILTSRKMPAVSASLGTTYNPPLPSPFSPLPPLV